MKRYVKLIISDEHGRSEVTMKTADERHTLFARRLAYNLIADEDITDTEWDAVVASAKAGVP